MTRETLRFTAPEPRSGEAVWRRIAHALGEEIRAHRFGEDGRLPSEAALADRFQVNRHTLRLAVQALQEQGLVRVERGRGMFARHPLLPYPLERRTRFGETLGRHGVASERRLLAACEEPACERVAGKLCLSGGTPVVRMESLCLADGEPISLMAAWYPAARFPGLLDLLPEDAGTSELLQRLGLADYVRAATQVAARMPTEAQARLLRQPATRPLLCVESVDADLSDVPVKFGETLFCGDRVQLCVRMAEVA